MKFSPYIKELLEQKIQQELRLPADCERLALDIETATGNHIGVNTMKRLLGFIDDERQPRTSTLDIISQYLGFDNWEALQVYDDKSNSSFQAIEDEVRVADLTIGQHILLSYLPDRQIEMEYMGDNRFRVLKSLNSKLLAGDEIIATHIVKGYPLLVNDVFRNGCHLGSFTAGKTQGVNFKLL